MLVWFVLKLHLVVKLWVCSRYEQPRVPRLSDVNTNIDVKFTGSSVFAMAEQFALAESYYVQNVR